jgi:hypothetical protein|tara:strand:+ start:1836 stop:2453 length:618 start_codon:yes stop_codon:yes gene_type:complete|mmetsp:Transcript_11983/g.55566  ORF Transcript_11983/g.55566 Transcript_11983/m.55566 type:complete len:206 (+) Transcript_11983:50-667(+)
MSRSEPTESFLALLRAAEEGEVEETMAEVIARFETSEDGDGDEADGKAGDSPEKERPGGLGPEGSVQAEAVGMELSGVLCSYNASKARVCHAPDSPSGAGTAKAIVAQLQDESMGIEKMVAVQESLADISGDAAALKTFIADARPAMGGALVMVSEDSELLQALAAELGLDNAHAFEHATGLLLAYPKEGEDGGEWTLIRRLSHE